MSRYGGGRSRAGRRRIATAGIVIVGLCTGTSAYAQEPEPSVSPLTGGVQSLAFAIDGSGTGSFGYWRMKSDRLNVGWEIGFGAGQNWSNVDNDQTGDTSSSSTSINVSIGPRFRRYVETDRRVVPFAETGLTAGYGFNRATTDLGNTSLSHNQHAANLRASLGIGVEWFPVTRVSVSGHTGMQAGVTYARGTSRVRTQDSWGLNLATFTSGLSFRIYLPQGSTLGGAQ